MNADSLVILHPNSKEDIDAIKAIAKALKIKFELTTKEKPYNQDFVNKILESKKQIEEGRYKVIETKDLWK
jgi:hypothetical protein